MFVFVHVVLVAVAAAALAAALVVDRLWLVVVSMALCTASVTVDAVRTRRARR